MLYETYLSECTWEWGILVQIFLSHSSDYQGALTQGGCYEQVSGTAHPMEVKRFDPPVHSLTQTEPSVSRWRYVASTMVYPNYWHERLMLRPR